MAGTTVRVVLAPGPGVNFVNATAPPAAPRPQPRDVVNSTLQDLGWYGQDGAAVPLQGVASRKPTLSQLKLLSQHRELLSAKPPSESGVQCNYSHMISGLFNVIANVDAALGLAREKGRVTSASLLQTPPKMEAVLADVSAAYYAAAVLEDLLMSPIVQEATSGTLRASAEHVTIVAGVARKLHRFLNDDLAHLRTAAAGGATTTTRIDRPLESLFRMLKTTVGVLWYLLAALAPVACVDVLRFLKNDAAPVAALSADLFRWFTVVASSALQVLVADPRKEFANAPDVAASFIADVVCACRFVEPHFYISMPVFGTAASKASATTSDRTAAAANELLVACRSVFIMTTQLCGVAVTADPSGAFDFVKPLYAAQRKLPLTATHQAAVRRSLLVALSSSSDGSSVPTIFSVFVRAALGNASPIMRLLAPADGKSISTSLPSPFAASPAPHAFLDRAVLTAFAMLPQPEVIVAALAPEERAPLLTSILRCIRLAVLNEEAFVTKRIAFLQPVHPMVYGAVVPFIAAVARSDAAFAHQALEALQAVASASAVIMSEIGGTATPPSSFLKHSVDVWHTALALCSAVARNPSLGADDAAGIIELLSSLFPAFYMEGVVNPPQKDSNVARRRAHEYAALRAMLREAMALAANEASAVERVLSSALRIATSDKFDKRFAETQRLHVFALALGSIEAAKRLSVAQVVRAHVPVALASLSSAMSPSLRVCGHDALIAPILAKHRVALVIVPTYVAIFAPSTASSTAAAATAAPAVAGGGAATGGSKLPPLALLNHFAKFVRAVCQAVEQCEGPAGRLSTEELAALQPQLSAEALASVKGLGAALHIVQSLYDNATKYCEIATPSQDAVQRRRAYVAALINTTQCSDPRVLSRVCASIEALLTAKITHPPEQDIFLGYASRVVQGSVNYSTKKDLAEWLLSVEEKVRAARTAAAGGNVAAPVMISKL